jgi:hypothetical protein
VSEREIAEIVSSAREGAFEYSDVGRLAPADLPKRNAALERSKRAINEAKAEKWIGPNVADVGWDSAFLAVIVRKGVTYRYRQALFA